MSVEKGNHCAYTTHYYIVFPVKYRRALLSELIVATIKQLTKELEERYEFEMEQVGCDENHIHLLCSLHPKYGPGQFVRLIKKQNSNSFLELGDSPKVKHAFHIMCRVGEVGWLYNVPKADDRHLGYTAAHCVKERAILSNVSHFASAPLAEASHKVRVS